MKLKYLYGDVKEGIYLNTLDFWMVSKRPVASNGCERHIFSFAGVKVSRNEPIKMLGDDVITQWGWHVFEEEETSSWKGKWMGQLSTR